MMKSNRAVSNRCLHVLVHSRGSKSLLGVDSGLVTDHNGQVRAFGMRMRFCNQKVAAGEYKTLTAVHPVHIYCAFTFLTFPEHCCAARDTRLLYRSTQLERNPLLYYSCHAIRFPSVFMVVRFEASTSAPNTRAVFKLRSHERLPIIASGFRHSLTVSYAKLSSMCIILETRREHSSMLHQRMRFVDVDKVLSSLRDLNIAVGGFANIGFSED